MQKILIADNCEDFSLVLSGGLRARFRVETCGDGARALELLRSFRPDVLIMDPMLPNVHGMDILRILKDEELCSAVIIAGRFLSDYVLESLRRYPVAYVTLKPCSIQAIIDRVEDLCAGMAPAQVQQPDPHCAVSSILLALGMSTHKKGFRYCRMGVLMLAEDPSRQVTKEIYPVIAREFGTSSTAVEKAIRSAIDSAWSQRSNELWRQYFTPASSGQVPRPTNTEFLSRLADALEMGQRRLAR